MLPTIAPTLTENAQFGDLALGDEFYMPHSSMMTRFVKVGDLRCAVATLNPDHYRMTNTWSLTPATGVWKIG